MTEAAGDCRIEDKEGNTFIPASQRPDGTWRKARRVRTGYVPQDEVPKYESKGKQFEKNKPTYPIGLSPVYVNEQANAESKHKPKIPGLSSDISGITTSASSGKKKKPKKKSKGHSDAQPEFTITEEIPVMPDQTEKTKTDTQTETVQEIQKRLKNVKKKINEIDSLQKKIDAGDLKNPEKNQLEKLNRKQEYEEEISILETRLSKLDV